MSELSEFEKELVLDNVKANLRMEGYEVSNADEELFRRYLNDECTLEELLRDDD